MKNKTKWMGICAIVALLGLSNASLFACGSDRCPHIKMQETLYKCPMRR